MECVVGNNDWKGPSGAGSQAGRDQVFARRDEQFRQASGGGGGGGGSKKGPCLVALLAAVAGVARGKGWSA